MIAKKFTTSLIMIMGLVSGGLSET